MIYPDQRGKAKLRVTEIWLVAVNTYGRSPKKLFIKINNKRESKVNIIEFGTPLNKTDESSPFSLISTSRIKREGLLKVTQNREGKARTTNTADQFNLKV